MSFTSVTAVLRAAGLAADHQHHSRAIFERLDGTVGRVEHAAHVIEEHALRLDVPLLAQVSRWDRLKDPLGILSAFAEHVHADSEEPHCCLPAPTSPRWPTIPRAPRSSRRSRQRGTGCPSASADACTLRYCRWTRPMRTL
jgi:trehalose synthase